MTAECSSHFPEGFGMLELAAPAFGSPLPTALHLNPIQHQPQGEKKNPMEKSSLRGFGRKIFLQKFSRLGGFQLFGPCAGILIFLLFSLFSLCLQVCFPCREQPGLAQGERGREQQSLGCLGWRAGAGIFQEGCVGCKSVGSWHSAAWRGMQGIPGCREFLVPTKPTKTPFSQWDPISQQSRPHIFRFWD